jgi:ribosomal protein S18 acetylase RimI-like enzyme
MIAPLVRRDAQPPVTCRHVTPNDLPAIAELMRVAYRGTIHDEDHSSEEALAYLLEHTYGDIVGRQLWDCSIVAVVDPGPVAVVLASEYSCHPLFYDICTHPEWRRRGLATTLIQLSMNLLIDRGYATVRLKVAVANTDARRVYERMGFLPE